MRAFSFKTITLFICIFLGCAYGQIINHNKNELNDIHSMLNKTIHADIVYPKTIAEIKAVIQEARKKGLAISISGGRHSMGAQQFGTNTINLSMTSYNHVIHFDSNTGIIEVESGMEWPDLVNWLLKNQQGQQKIWGIHQKQTGADRLTIGGALSSNVHGRGLKAPPIISDVESFTLINANGEMILCSRTKNPELFRLVIGGYGLFGVIATVKLRLVPVTVLQRDVKIIKVADFIPLVTLRTKEGYLYGDFQFDIDPKSDLFMNRGIYSLYKPVNTNINQISLNQKELSEQNWTKLLILAHTDKSKAFDLYSKFYLSTNGQLYRSDTNQMGVYINDYHKNIDKNASEVISEIYVPRDKLATLFKQLRADFRQYHVNVIYGTVRLIEKDNESYLPWATQNYACIVFNFHVEHTPAGIEKAKHDFRLIIDRALEYNGSYFLTYHRWARKDQVLKAYPQFVEFLKLKLKYDPSELFQSDWYRYYKNMFSQELNKK